MPNELVAEIHDRMPLILAPGDYVRWLSDEPEAEQREHARLVEGRKALHPVAVAVRDHIGVVGEPLRAIAVSPAAFVL